MHENTRWAVHITALLGSSATGWQMCVLCSSYVPIELVGAEVGMDIDCSATRPSLPCCLTLCILSSSPCFFSSSALLKITIQGHDVTSIYSSSLNYFFVAHTMKIIGFRCQSFRNNARPVNLPCPFLADG